MRIKKAQHCSWYVVAFLEMNKGKVTVIFIFQSMLHTNLKEMAKDGRDHECTF